MRILAINTCLGVCDLAIAVGETVVAEHTEPMARGQDAHLPDRMTSLLETTGLALADIDRFVVVTGPGSFTGIRIGVAFARGLGLALGRDVFGLTALEAGLQPGRLGEICVSLPAKTRPPDQTFWVQWLRDDFRAGEAEEWKASTLAKLSHIPAEPRARWAAIKARKLLPAEFPPVPVYVRAPDAVPMRPRDT